MPELSSRRKIIKAYRAACATRSPSVRRKMEILKELRHGLTYFAGEAVDCSDLMEEAADRIEALEALAMQYRSDLRHPVTDPGSLQRRLESIDKLMGG
jgi:hypothetical protein